MSASAGKWALALSLIDTALVALILGSDVITHKDRARSERGDHVERVLTALEQGRVNLRLDPSAKQYAWYPEVQAMLSGSVDDTSIDFTHIGAKQVPVELVSHANGHQTTIKMKLSPEELQLAAMAGQHMLGGMDQLASHLSGETARLVLSKSSEMGTLSHALTEGQPANHVTAARMVEKGIAPQTGASISA